MKQRESNETHLLYMLDNNYPMTAELAYQMDVPNLGNEIIDFLLSHSPQL